MLVGSSPLSQPLTLLSVLIDMGKSYLGVPVEFLFSDFIKVIILGLGLVIVQGSLVGWVGLDGYGPEWVLVLMVYVCLRAELWVAIICALILGLFRDAMSGWLWGFHPLIFIMIIWMFYPLRTRLNFFSALTLIPLIFILCLGGYLFVMTPLMVLLGWPGSDFNPLPSFISSSILTAITAPFIFKFLHLVTSSGDTTPPIYKI